MHVYKWHILNLQLNMIEDTCLFPFVVAQSLLSQGPWGSRIDGLPINVELKK
jgi:hypothetical protein